MFAALRDDTYNAVLVVHLLAVVIGIAPLAAGVWLRSAGASDEEHLSGLARAQHAAVQRVATVAWVAVLATGVGMVVLSDDAIGFADTWVSLAFGLWFGIVGVTSAMVGRGYRQRAGGDAKGDDLVLAGIAIVGVLVVMAFYVMIFKPGV